MPLVKAQCTQCGAPLEVDNSKEVAVCPYCKTPFIVEKAINNFNISNANIYTNQMVLNENTELKNKVNLLYREIRNKIKKANDLFEAYNRIIIKKGLILDGAERETLKDIQALETRFETMKETPIYSNEEVSTLKNMSDSLESIYLKIQTFMKKNTEVEKNKTVFKIFGHIALAIFIIILIVTISKCASNFTSENSSSRTSSVYTPTSNSNPIKIVSALKVTSSVTNVFTQTYNTTITGKIRNDTTTTYTNVVFEFEVETTTLGQKAILSLTISSLSPGDKTINSSTATKGNFEKINSVIVKIQGMNNFFLV
ncbi:MAG: hypothetical protein LBM99_06305 [Bacillales bacterium]|jgi:hypothetical protein|nr:hypothetical protein [Bacillales bacterium]